MAMPQQEAELSPIADPKGVIDTYANIAAHLKDVLVKGNLYSNINGKAYVLCDGWTVLATICNLNPVIVWTKDVRNTEGTHLGYEARCEVMNANGVVVAAAEAQCTVDESMWARRDRYALRSMAQTRAMAKSIRSKLGFVVAMAGYATTPAEEMMGTDQHTVDACHMGTAPNQQQGPPASRVQAVAAQVTMGGQQ